MPTGSAGCRTPSCTSNSIQVYTSWILECWAHQSFGRALQGFLHRDKWRFHSHVLLCWAISSWLLVINFHWLKSRLLSSSLRSDAILADYFELWVWQCYQLYYPSTEHNSSLVEQPIETSAQTVLHGTRTTSWSKSDALPFNKDLAVTVPITTFLNVSHDKVSTNLPCRHYIFQHLP